MLTVLTVSGTPLTVIDVEDCMGFRVNLLDSVLPYLPEEGSVLEQSLQGNSAKTKPGLTLLCSDSVLQGDAFPL